MIKDSELIVNKDGSIFHLHLTPEQLADNIILVGDPGRVELFAQMMDKLEVKVQNREFVTVTGQINDRRLTVLSTGIGTDNIDIVVNELDALANIDLRTREIKNEHRTLNFIRIGTSGSLQAEIPVNSYVVSQKAIGFDGLLNYYAGRDSISDLEFEVAFKKHLNWLPKLTDPYVVNSSETLYKKIFTNEMINGITISAPGFYGPQGRVLRLGLSMPEMNEKIESFQYKGQKITNF
ncbi:MAG: nucleoside phosphorylase, partial [Bacteroidota bacterium]|nr:nucleoside phosphorylase [Bacteroidota bacterium]